MTKNTKAVLQYYFSLNKPRFSLSLEAITRAVFGDDPKGTKKRRVQRANTFLRDAGVITWIPGFGAVGAFCTPNEYRLDPAAIRAYKRRLKKIEQQSQCADDSVQMTVLSGRNTGDRAQGTDTQIYRYTDMDNSSQS